ncbi:hypothetical protein M2459_001403 [Parabacteroides sp. PF5-5]|uniref:porin family protein n=1 Tax=unclassified Parabacteroides TaxID=2649774 RepID=UPI002472E88B|nr:MULTISPECIES: porin family protein [unclassified Parabacteroides]MDH6304667.1 hypothetical protein [Parabacteroides sp. PH5-39]MDH6315719.1 hypothetical protein [Parabacteroides sp. PF5-13]MDH6319379.1 hypothetical protein [Parabacteroides sp. PH5-13]MDH6323110.1 hypothetical protein [Parabacteroides sp. PH5-8]MDH6326912.1 hypothetical protein [Parabacteroides sp. PH5-41]
MKKVTVVCMLIMSSLTVLHAQWSLTPEAGITAINRAGNDDWTAGWKLGVGLEYEFNNRFSLKSGLHYSQRGYSYNYLMPFYFSDPAMEYGSLDYVYSHGDMNRHFLQIPLMAKFSFDLTKDARFNFAAGPYIGFCINESWGYGTWVLGEEPQNPNPYHGYYGNYGYGGYGGYGSYYYSSNNNNRKTFDWGLSFSMGVEVKNWVMNLGYELDLGKEYRWDSMNPKYHTFSLSVGYKFKLGK